MPGGVVPGAGAQFPAYRVDSPDLVALVPVGRTPAWSTASARPTTSRGGRDIGEVGEDFGPLT